MRDRAGQPAADRGGGPRQASALTAIGRTSTRHPATGRSHMHRYRNPFAAFWLTVLILAASALASAPAPAKVRARAADASPSAPWMATDRSPSWRANQLLAAMTLDEKLAMVHGGALAAGAGAGSIPGNQRLGIPALSFSDSPLGVGNFAFGVTQWPDAVNNAATWDPDLVGQYGSAVGAEFWGKGRNVALGPTVDIVRVPLWGRAFETFGEDPLLNSRLGVADIRGIQSQNVLATAKHFAVKSQETPLEYNARVGERALHEIYFPAFESAVKDAHVGAVMCAYNRVNGDYSCENADLLTRALRDLWGFAGFVMSDWGATHSTVKAANAGLDVEMPGAADGSTFFGTALKQVVLSGQVPMARLDQMVGNVLTAMFAVGLFDNPAPAAAARINTVVSTPEHRQLAEHMSEEGSVLLQTTDTRCRWRTTRPRRSPSSATPAMRARRTSAAARRPSNPRSRRSRRCRGSPPARTTRRCLMRAAPAARCRCSRPIASRPRAAAARASRDLLLDDGLLGDAARRPHRPGARLWHGPDRRVLAAGPRRPVRALGGHAERRVDRDVHVQPR
jgi:beta-glucosidase-like glycosyl hydrolase